MKMKPFNNRVKIQLGQQENKENPVFKTLDSSQKYTLATYLEHSSNNKTVEQDIYEIVSKYKANQEIFVFVETHMIEEIEFDGGKHHFVPISAIVCFTSKAKSTPLRSVKP